MHSVLRASLLPAASAVRPAWVALMAKASADALRSYRRLVYDDPEFVRYFREVTPIDLVSQLLIGSRPSKRQVGDRIEDLRAIPWVFSWTQSRYGLPGWFGVGSALHATPESGVLAEMYRGWPFFRSLIDNAQLGLGRSDLGIARLYDGLADADLARRIFAGDGSRVASHDRGHRGRDRRAARCRGRRCCCGRSGCAIPTSIPLSFVQVALLARLREASEDAPEADTLRRLAALTINGIAAGLQNTG